MAYGPEPSRAEIDRLPGAVVVDFGNNWCGYCRAAKPAIERAFAAHPRVKHIQVADGSGQPLGRSFGVKLWPTLVFLRDGQEVARLVRPYESESILDALEQVDTPQ